MWIYQRRTTLGSWDGQKEHAVVVRSTFPSQNVQITSGSEHFSKLRCRNSARLFVRSAFPSQNVLKKTMPGLKVQMSFCVAGARDSAPCQKWAKTWGFCCSFSCNHNYITLHYATLHYRTQDNTTQHKLQLPRQRRLHYIILPYTSYITLRCTTSHCTLCYTTLH